jgi:hypothetical protein
MPGDGPAPQNEEASALPRGTWSKVGLWALDLFCVLGVGVFAAEIPTRIWTGIGGIAFYVVAFLVTGWVGDQWRIRSRVAWRRRMGAWPNRTELGTALQAKFEAHRKRVAEGVVLVEKAGTLTVQGAQLVAGKIEDVHAAHASRRSEEARVVSEERGHQIATEKTLAEKRYKSSRGLKVCDPSRVQFRTYTSRAEFDADWDGLKAEGWSQVIDPQIKTSLAKDGVMLVIWSRPFADDE